MGYVLHGDRRSGSAAVEMVLAENEQRWESLSEGDRERLRAAARAIAQRLLHEPTLRLKRSAGDDDAYAKVAVLRELFALDAGTEPLERSEAEVSDLSDRRRRRGEA